MHIPPRKMIHPRDIANLTGCSDRNARKILQRIRAELGKLARDYVSIEEFCMITNIDERVVDDVVNHKRRERSHE